MGCGRGEIHNMNPSLRLTKGMWGLLDLLVILDLRVKVGRIRAPRK